MIISRSSDNLEVCKCFWLLHLWLLASQRGIRLPMDGSSFDYFESLKYPLNWSLIMFKTVLSLQLLCQLCHGPWVSVEVFCL